MSDGCASSPKRGLTAAYHYTTSPPPTTITTSPPPTTITTSRCRYQPTPPRQRATTTPTSSTQTWHPHLHILEVGSIGVLSESIWPPSDPFWRPNNLLMKNGLFSSVYLEIPQTHLHSKSRALCNSTEGASGGWWRRKRAKWRMSLGMSFLLILLVFLY